MYQLGWGGDFDNNWAKELVVEVTDIVDSCGGCQRNSGRCAVTRRNGCLLSTSFRRTFFVSWYRLLTGPFGSGIAESTQYIYMFVYAIGGLRCGREPEG